MNESPENIFLTEDDIEKTSTSLVIADNKIVVNGIDGGFYDDFSSGDLSRYISSNAVIEGGNVRFTDSTSNIVYNNYIVSDIIPITGTQYYGIQAGVYEVKARRIAIDTVNNNYLYFTTDLMTPVRYNNSSGFYMYYTKDVVYIYAFGGSTTASFQYTTAQIPIGAEITFRIVDESPLGSSLQNATRMYFKINNEEWINTGIGGINRGYVGFGLLYAYSSVNSFEFLNFAIYGYPEKITLTLNKTSSLVADLPAKLKTLDSISLTTEDSKQGSIALSLQKKDARLAEWSDLDDKIAEFSTVADVKNGGSFIAPVQEPAPEREFIIKLEYSNGGVSGYNTINLPLQISWTSDIEAPLSPSASEVNQFGEAGAVLKAADALLEDVYGAQIEVDINNNGYLPLSERSILETDNNHLILRSTTGEKQRAGEHNSLVYALTGLNIDDTIRIRSRFVDEVGNASAFKNSGLITIKGTLYAQVPVKNFKTSWKTATKWGAKWTTS